MCQTSRILLGLDLSMNENLWKEMMVYFFKLGIDCKTVSLFLEILCATRELRGAKRR